MGPTLTLLQAAFGHTATPYSVLQCPTSSSSDELKRAYRVAALKYHPDRQIIRHGVQQSTHADEGGSSSSLKFQAVSAAYQVLMDDAQRAYYDKTGIIREDEHDHHHHDDNSNSSTRHTSSTNNNRHRRGGDTRDWKTFFESVFNDIQQTGKNHNEAANIYRNSNDEMIDVLRYYTLCHGDMNLIVECVPYGNKIDIDRWFKDIIYPAISCGKIPNYNVETVTKQQNRKRVVPAQRLRFDSNDQHVYNAAKNNIVLKSQKRRIILEDSSSDDEDVYDKDNAITTIDDDDDDERKATQVVSKRNKMDIRVAKKRKAKAVKEMEIANILHSKDWKKNGMSAAAAAATQKRKKNMEYGISDALLSNLEAKYCHHSGNDKKKKKEVKKSSNETLILRK
jgi:hypothetical protein